MTGDLPDASGAPGASGASGAPGSPDGGTGEGGGPAGSTEHHDDGLDLARSLTRATSGAGGTPTSRRRRRRRGTTPGRTSAPPDRTGGWSGPGPDERDPRPLADMVEGMVADRGWDLDLRVRGVFARWAELVGPQVAAHAVPQTLTDGVLVVQCDSTAWATELRLLAPTVVRAVCSELGDGTVTAVEVRGPRPPRGARGGRRVAGGRGPRDTYG